MIRETEDAVYFDSGIPSNFETGYPIVVEAGWSVMSVREHEFATNEHYFQAVKVQMCDQGTKEMWEEIAFADTAREAKRLGRLVPLVLEEREYWDETAAPIAMLTCCLAKFQQHYDCWVWLKGTGAKRLIEHRRDPVWGDNLDGSGRNQLGHTLMLVRTVVC